MGQAHFLEARMTEVHFHYSKQGALVDQCGALVSDLTEARDYAEQVVRLLIATPSQEDWRSWVSAEAQKTAKKIDIKAA